MTGKLMKYELRSMLRLFLPVWGALLLISLLNRFSIRSDAFHRFLNGIPAGLLMTAYVLGIIAVAVIALVFVIQRFYNGLLKEEGYLMFTLPVRTPQLIWAKCLAASLLTMITALVCMASIFILVFHPDAVRGFLDAFFGADAAESAEVAMQAFLRAAAVFGIPLLILSVIVTILRAYLAMAIGQCANRKKVFCSVVSYIGIRIAVTAAFSSLAVRLALGIDNGRFQWLRKWFDALAAVSRQGDIRLLVSTIWKVGASCAAVAAVVLLAEIALYYFPTELLLRKKLNLE